MTRHHLAQANIARMRAPIEHPSMESFRVQLESINRLADESPGFVWRLQTDAGDATGIRAFEDERILFNMSVWESVRALHAYTYLSAHAAVLRARRAWFEPTSGPGLVLWWIPAGTLPSIDDAKARLKLLAERGPSASAFTFRQVFPPPGEDAIETPEVAAEFCNEASRMRQRPFRRAARAIAHDRLCRAQPPE